MLVAYLVSPVSFAWMEINSSCAVCAGSSVGRIVQAASADAAAGTQDGILSFQEGRDTLHVSFGAAQVRPAPALCRALMPGLCVTLCSLPGVSCKSMELMLPCGPQGRASVTQLILCIHCCRSACIACKPGHRSRCQKDLHVGGCTSVDCTESLCCLPSFLITWRSCLHHATLCKTLEMHRVSTR